ncbi:hypothetical protein U1839_10875 [Sphingomonas sp. RT2P30]|uniref:hypothetical protein n=1 Tax=Parasphingomonas halimpatiens TaxID=3096162 RepID=UPI002FC75D9F
MTVDAGDCMIFATGFDFGNSYGASAQQQGHPIYGRGGISLADEYYGGGPIAFDALIRDWRADGLKGLTID